MFANEKLAARSKSNVASRSFSVGAPMLMSEPTVTLNVSFAYPTCAPRPM